MTERIQKILSARGVASRRKAEEMITAGRVTVNGKTAVLGDSANPDTDRILIDGNVLPSTPGPVYIMLHKPRGYVTTLSDEKGRKTVAQLVADCGQRVYPVGRLDYDSEGLLLLTNDGEFANAMMHPKHRVEKTYAVWVSGYREEATRLLKQPIVLDGYRIHPPKVNLIRAEGNKALYHVSIGEGRNRQVRRMCAHAGMEVLRLKRIREGKLELGDLPLGKWRYLTQQEIAEL